MSWTKSTSSWISTTSSRFWAVESLIGFWDGYSNNQNNYWLYENRDNGKFYFMPWGADGAFMGVRGPFGFGQQGATSVYAESMLANRLYHDKGVADRYRQTMQRDPCKTSGKKTSCSNRSIASKPW